MKCNRFLFSFFFYVFGKPYAPGGLAFQVIDSWTCSGCEHETLAGAEHSPLSVHLSRGAFTVCSCKKIDVQLVSTFHSQFQLTPCSLSMGLVCELQEVWDSVVTSTLGGPWFYGVKTPPLHAEMQSFIFHA